MKQQLLYRGIASPDIVIDDILSITKKKELDNKDMKFICREIKGYAVKNELVKITNIYADKDILKTKYTTKRILNRRK